MDCKYPHCTKCEYPDCIHDRLEATDFDNDMWEETSREKNLRRRRNKRYRDSHKEFLNEKSREWNTNHAERVKETTRKWQQENKQRIAAMKRARYAQNPTLYRQKQQDYRVKIKANLPHCDDCASCILVEKEKQDGYRRLCVEKMRLIEQKVSNCPRWCDKRRAAGCERKNKRTT